MKITFTGAITYTDVKTNRNGERTMQETELVFDNVTLNVDLGDVFTGGLDLESLVNDIATEAIRKDNTLVDGTIVPAEDLPMFNALGDEAQRHYVALTKVKKMWTDWNEHASTPDRVSEGQILVEMADVLLDAGLTGGLSYNAIRVEAALDNIRSEGTVPFSARSQVSKF